MNSDWEFLFLVQSSPPFSRFYYSTRWVYEKKKVKVRYRLFYREFNWCSMSDLLVAKRASVTQYHIKEWTRIYSISVFDWTKLILTFYLFNSLFCFSLLLSSEFEFPVLQQKRINFRMSPLNPITIHYQVESERTGQLWVRECIRHTLESSSKKKERR